MSEESVQSFVDFYRPQVLAYAAEWEKAFGYKVKESGLYFAQLDNAYIELNVDMF